VDEHLGEDRMGTCVSPPGEDKLLIADHIQVPGSRAVVRDGHLTNHRVGLRRDLVLHDDRQVGV